MLLRGQGVLMFSARWAHRSLLAICIFVVVVVAGYASWEGVFGVVAQGWVRNFVDPALDRFPHGEKLERIARVLGALGTVMTATFGIYKAVYYADRNLPERLTQFLAQSDQRLMDVRSVLLDYDEISLAEHSQRDGRRENHGADGKLRWKSRLDDGRQHWHR